MHATCSSPSRPSTAGDLIAAIGPSLGPCCAEFVHYRKEIPRSFWPYKNADHHFNFWAISHDQLCEAGVPTEHIFASKLCTRCHADRFFSYRGEGTTGSPFSYAGPLTEANHLGNVAYRVGKKIEWDREKMECIGCPEADPMIRRQPREGWSLG